MAQYPAMLRACLPTLIVVAFCNLFLWAADPAAPLTLRYSIFSGANLAGTEVDIFRPNGIVDCTYEFNDRGRGPKTTTRYELRASDGLLSRTDITGNDYLKAPVDEHFLVQNARFAWKSTSESGHSETPGFYVSVNGPGEEMAFLVSALLKANGSLKLLPSGEARLERMTDANVEHEGQKLHVTAFAISGLWFDPQIVWLDDDQHLFGFAGASFFQMREGWESANQHLYQLQRKAEDTHYERLAKQLAGAPGHPIAIEHVRVFDSENAVVHENQSVVIRDHQIIEVGSANKVMIPDDATRIDGSGKTLLPALFDMHAHTQPIDGLMYIASGVTSIRDMGNDIEGLQHLQDQWQNGTAIGPRIFKAGFIDGRGPFTASTKVLADSPEEALADVKHYADLGYIQIKLYSSLKPELVPGIIEAAHARGLRVSGHIPNGMVARQFVEEGADEIQHINFIFLNFLSGKVKDTRTPERFTAVGDNAAKLDLNSKEVADFIDLLKQRHTTLDVTLGAFEGMFTGRPGKPSPEIVSVLDRLPAQVQRSAYIGGLPVSADNDQLYKDSYDAMLRMTKRMYDAGVAILAGTDAPTRAGIMLHRELELEVKAGIPPAKALQIATWNASRLLKQDKQLGSIAAGKEADLLLVEGNPAEQISDIRRCRLVVKDGVLFNSADLYAAVGMKSAP